MTTREEIIAEAYSWLATPYRHLGTVKGAGCDCMTFIVQVAKACGLLQDFNIEYYSPQFNLHRSEETYLDGILKYCREVETPQPGDLALYRFGRCFSHAGIVVDWPTIIHSSTRSGVILEDTARAAWLSRNNGQPRERKFFSYW